MWSVTAWGQSHFSDCWKNSCVWGSLGCISSGTAWGHTGNTHMHVGHSAGCYHVSSHRTMLGATSLACSRLTLIRTAAVSGGVGGNPISFLKAMNKSPNCVFSWWESSWEVLKCASRLYTAGNPVRYKHWHSCVLYPRCFRSWNRHRSAKYCTHFRRTNHSNTFKPQLILSKWECNLFE